MKNIMTEYQRELTTNNLHLVKEVIQKRIKINNLPLLAYEDFYAIGCEALCRAAMAYQPSRGEFAPLGLPVHLQHLDRSCASPELFPLFQRISIH